MQKEKDRNHLPEQIVDFHVHLFPDNFFKAIWKAFVRDYGWEVLHQFYYRECVDYLREQGVGSVVYSNYAHKQGAARVLNDWNLKVVDELDRVYCFAAFHPDDPDALDYARDVLSHPKILGFKLQLLVQNFYPNDPRMFPLYELILEKNKRLLFHAGTGPVGNPFVGVKYFKKVMERFPGLSANVAHMGGLEYGEFMDLLDVYDNLVLDTAFSFLPTKGYDQGVLKLLKYKDRIVYGSDFPNLIFPRESEIDNLLGLGLSREFYENVFYSNAEALIENSGQGGSK